MDEKKKRQYDTVPDVIMNGTDDSFFKPHYPVEFSEGSINAVLNGIADETLTTDADADGDLRTEQML